MTSWIKHLVRNSLSRVYFISLFFLLTNDLTVLLDSLLLHSKL